MDYATSDIGGARVPAVKPLMGSGSNFPLLLLAHP